MVLVPQAVLPNKLTWQFSSDVFLSATPYSLRCTASQPGDLELILAGRWRNPTSHLQAQSAYRSMPESQAYVHSSGSYREFYLLSSRNTGRPSSCGLTSNRRISLTWYGQYMYPFWSSISKRLDYGPQRETPGFKLAEYHYYYSTY